MKKTVLSIGQLSRETGCKVQTIRYYEQIGLLPEAARSPGNQRLYSTAQLRRLAFIRHSRDLGFSLQSIRELLTLADDPSQPCEAANEIARVQLQDVEARIERLELLRDELKRMVVQCQSNRIEDCRVIEVLADHSLCLHEHALEQ